MDDEDPFCDAWRKHQSARALRRLALCRAVYGNPVSVRNPYRETFGLLSHRLTFALSSRGLNIMNPSVRLFFMTGFLGALTTFSTFALETVNSIRAETYLIAAANFLSNNLLGGALVLLGMWVGGLK